VEAAERHDAQSQRRVAFRQQQLLQLRRGLAHAEAWANSARIRYDSDFSLGNYLGEVPPSEAIDCLRRVLQAKAAAGVQDDTYRLIRRTSLREVQDASERYAGAVALANLAFRPRDKGEITALFIDLGGMHESPEFRAALDQLSQSSNPIAKEAALETRTVLAKMAASMTAGAKTPKIEPPQANHPASARATIRRVDLGEVGSILGLVSSHDRDLLVTCLDPGDTPARLWELSSTFERRLIANFNSHCQPCFDGKYVWLAGNPQGKPVLEIVDPVSGEKWFIQPKQGLPDAPILNLVYAPLHAGQVCVAAEIGQDRQSRSWIGLAKFDASSHTGQATVFYEAKQNAIVDRASRDSADAVFAPLDMYLLTSGTAIGDKPATVIIASPGHFLSLALPADKAEVRFEKTSFTGSAKTGGSHTRFRSSADQRGKPNRKPYKRTCRRAAWHLVAAESTWPAPTAHCGVPASSDSRSRRSLQARQSRAIIVPFSC
jgi:hypothetical protein